MSCEDQALGWTLDCVTGPGTLTCDLGGVNGGGHYDCYKDGSGAVHCDTVLGYTGCFEYTSIFTYDECSGSDDSWLTCSRGLGGGMLWTCEDSLGQTFQCSLLTFTGQFSCD